VRQVEARGVSTRPVARLDALAGRELGRDDDRVAVEEPLEIRVDGEPVAITMRTPGADERLALGFLFSEGLIDSLTDVGTIARCGRPGHEGSGNVVDVRSGPGLRIDIERVLLCRRFSVTSSSCGVCGRRSIESLLARVGRAPEGLALSPALVTRAIARLASAQPNFTHTGGVHAAAAFAASGELLCVYEDIGRHNAVDKVIGDLLYRGLVDAVGDMPAPGAPALLTVSGRASFEIVQKAAAARIPVVASVSAASSLAVDLAQATGITLAAFVRGGALNVYTHAPRLAAVA